MAVRMEHERTGDAQCAEMAAQPHETAAVGAHRQRLQLICLEHGAL